MDSSNQQGPVGYLSWAQAANKAAPQIGGSNVQVQPGMANNIAAGLANLSPTNWVPQFFAAIFSTDRVLMGFGILLVVVGLILTIYQTKTVQDAGRTVVKLAGKAAA